MYSHAAVYRPVVGAIAQALRKLLPPGATVFEEHAKLVLVIRETRDAVELGQLISDAVADGNSFEDAVRACTTEALGQIQDMIAREVKAPWPQGPSGGDFLFPAAEIQGGVLAMSFGEQGDANVANVDLRSCRPPDSPS